jgi:hypothetical protein
MAGSRLPPVLPRLGTVRIDTLEILYVLTNNNIWIFRASVLRYCVWTAFLDLHINPWSIVTSKELPSRYLAIYHDCGYSLSVNTSLTVGTYETACHCCAVRPHEDMARRLWPPCKLWRSAALRITVVNRDDVVSCRRMYTGRGRSCMALCAG